MAAGAYHHKTTGTLPKPGSEYGPCTNLCAHPNCAETRKMAEAVCGYCNKKIGYNTRFYDETTQKEQKYCHTLCLERRIEDEKKL